MSDKFTLTDDKTTGRKTIIEIDSDNVTIETRQDVTPIIEQNKALQNAGREHYAHDPNMWHAASIPNGVIVKWRNEHGIDVYNPEHWPKVAALLNSNEYRYLRAGEFNL